MLILVGADKLEPTAQAFFRILASGSSYESDTRAKDESWQPSGIMGRLDFYHPEQQLDRVLEALVKRVPCDGAFLTVRWGEYFRIERVWNCSTRAVGFAIPISSSSTLMKMVETGQGSIDLNTTDAAGISRLTELSEHPVQSYMRAPFLIGKRVIGGVVYLSKSPNHFKNAHLVRTTQLMGELAPVVENSIMYSQATRYLQRFALLNDLAAAASLRIGVGEIAKVLIKKLRNIFNTEHVSLLLRSEGQRVLHKYGKAGALSEPYSLPLEVSNAWKVIQTGQPFCSGDIQEEVDRYRVTEGIRSVLIVPLKYQGEMIGAIQLESERLNAFSETDQQLLVMIASQMAGLFENARLNQEMQERNAELQKRIEAQKLAEIRLVRSARLAAVGEMAAGIAHELNNPLTSIVGFVELAVEELPEEHPLRSDLELALSEAQRARSVLRRLLDFSRKSENTRQPVEVNSLVDETLALIQHQIGNSGIETCLELSPELPKIFVDREQIKQVLLNLIQNAVQAMPEGGRLCIRTDKLKDPEYQKKPGIILSVQDSGLGIPSENLERVFDPFFTTRPVGEGTGLGLAVSYGIVTAHHGLINVESEPGQGSCFTVWLPVMENLVHG